MSDAIQQLPAPAQRVLGPLHNNKPEEGQKKGLNFTTFKCLLEIS